MHLLLRLLKWRNALPQASFILKMANCSQSCPVAKNIGWAAVLARRRRQKGLVTVQCGLIDQLFLLKEFDVLKGMHIEC
jgi:hypothetical protein